MEAKTPDRIYDALFSTPSMVSALSDVELLGAMLRFEVALYDALEDVGIAPEGSGSAIRAIQPEYLDVARLSAESRTAGNLCIPFVKMLTALVEKVNPAAAGYVHWGATSQDVQDTAMVLQAQAAWCLLRQQLDVLCASLALLAAEYKGAALPGRTWLQQGPPTTLGLKIAGWLDALLRHRVRMAQAAERNFVLQFGGAVGTLAALGKDAVPVSQKLAASLDLALPPVPWHTQRDRMAELASTLGMLAGTLGKVGRDISLLMQTEVGECMEVSGSGGSSTMPHKHNPVSAAIMLSAAVRVPPLVGTMLAAMVQEHERGLGGWHAEWETLPEIFRLTAGSLESAIVMAQTLRGDEDAMARNLEVLRGAAMSEALVFALAAKVGRKNAHALVEEIASRALGHNSSLLEVACKDVHVRELLTPEKLEQALQPETYLGCSIQWVDDILRIYGDLHANS